MVKYLIPAILVVMVAGVQAQKIACIGASITYGARIENREQNSYPAQLQRMLGDGYQVVNYGVSGTTLLRKGDNPYWRTEQYKAAMADQPDVVVIDLGGNDAKLINRVYLDEYEQDYKDFIRSFTQLPSHPRVILLLAMASFVKDTTGIWDPVIVKQVNPRIQNVAYAEGVEVIDMHSPFVNKEANMPDELHPDKEGAGIMARNIYRVIRQARDKEFDVFGRLGGALVRNSFYGYECAAFTFAGRDCKIVRPKVVAKGHPWVWRARFWAHEPQTDIALLQQGFHIAYCDVAELLGNRQAIGIWDKYYQLLHGAGLAEKAVLEGMSRGGVYVFNWAAVNPDKVSCVYVDNPLLNIPAWGMQFLKGAKVEDPLYPLFVDFKKDYKLVSDEDVMRFRGSPVEKAKEIVKGGYPILIVCADADSIVLPKDNTVLFEAEVRSFGGKITVLHKQGFGHHPHSLPNPAPIVDFILEATGYGVGERARPTTVGGFSFSRRPILEKILSKVKLHQPNLIRQGADYSLLKLKLVQEVESKAENKWGKRIISFGIKKMKLQDIDFQRGDLSVNEVIKVKDNRAAGRGTA